MGHAAPHRKASRRDASRLSIAVGHEGTSAFASLPNGAVPGQPEGLLWAYADDDAHDRALHDTSAPEQRAAVRAVLFALDLFTAAFVRGDERDQQHLNEATARWEFPGVGVHPLSGQTVSLLDADPGCVTFPGAYQAPLCSLALSCDLFIQCANLLELAALGGHPEKWSSRFATFIEVAAPPA